MILVILLHPEKALPPMLVTLLGILILRRPLQSANAYCPIFVTLAGITMSVISVHLVNARSAIVVTPFAIETLPEIPAGAPITSVIALLYRIPSTRLYVLFRSDSSMSFRMLHPSNMFVPK